MTEAQIKEELDQIHTSRMAILKTGMSYSRTGLQLSRASLPQLESLEKHLLGKLAKITGQNIFVGDFR